MPVSATDPDEFSFLAADASLVRRSAPLPTVSRVELTSAVSALAWGEPPASAALLHGAALNAHTWDATLLAWPSRNEPSAPGFLALDLPGHGDSAWRPDANYAPSLLVPAVSDALDRAIDTGVLDAEFTLIGHSLGGLTALESLRAGRARFARLVLVDIVPLPPQAARTVASFLDGPPSFGSRQEIVERALAFGFGGGIDELTRAVILNTKITADGRIAWKHHLGILGGQGLPLTDAETLWPVIAASRVPIDLVAATESLIDAHAIERFTQLRPTAQVVRLAGGHNLQEDAPVDLARTLATMMELPRPTEGA